MKLIANKIPGLKPGKYYGDSDARGLQLRVHQEANGTITRTWLFRYAHDGKASQRALIGQHPEISLADARIRATELRALLNKGIDPKRAGPQRRAVTTPLPGGADVAGCDAKHTVDYLISEFVQRFIKRRYKCPEQAIRILNVEVLQHWKGRDARAIKPREVMQLLDGIVQRGSLVMANHVARLLRKMFAFGIPWEIVDDSPVKLAEMPGGALKPRERHLSEDELRAYLADPIGLTRYARLSHIITLLLLTGQRRGELAQARWDEIDLKARTWTIPDANSKNGRGHIVPLTDWAVDEFRALQGLARAGRTGHADPRMRSLRSMAGDWVLPNKAGDGGIEPRLLTRGIAKCLKRARALGIKPFTLHDLRRTCRTGLSQLKVPPHISERVLNHTPEKLQRTYDRFEYLPEKREALEKWAAHLAALRPVAAAAA